MPACLFTVMTRRYFGSGVAVSVQEARESTIERFIAGELDNALFMFLVPLKSKEDYLARCERFATAEGS